MKIAILPAFLLLSGCGIANRYEDRQEYVKARQQYEESTGAYRSCLSTNPGGPRACETQKLAMESDERAFNNIAGHGGNFNIQQR